MALSIYTCQYVLVSDVFEKFPALKRKFDEGGDYDFSWGDNNRSMIDIDTLVTAVDQLGEVGEEDLVAFCAQFDGIDKHAVYVDLEN